MHNGKQSFARVARILNVTGSLEVLHFYIASNNEILKLLKFTFVKPWLVFVARPYHLLRT